MGGLVTENTAAALVPVGLNVGQDARDYIAASRSAATLRAYQSDLRDFERYCEERGRAALPAEPSVVADYLAYLAQHGMAASTIGRCTGPSRRWAQAHS
jgi:site-specific recombinase XerD